MTEDEAKTKWCPHAVASHNDPRRGFHDGEKPEDMTHIFNCLGSRCMAWRWETEINTQLASDFAAEAVENGTPFPREKFKAIRNGYCGLAGRPE